MSGLVRLFALFSKLGKRASQTAQVKKGTHPQLKKGRKLTKSETPVKEVQTRPKQSLQGQKVKPRQAKYKSAIPGNKPINDKGWPTTWETAYKDGRNYKP